MNYGKLEFL